jgi:hypothetical protein
MSWQRGLFRLWLVGSILWICVVVWIAYDRISTVVRLRAAPDYTPFGTPRPISAFVWDYSLYALVPVLGSLALGLAVAWITTGFRADKS